MRCSALPGTDQYCVWLAPAGNLVALNASLEGVVIFIVEVRDKAGSTARKEYEGMNLREVLRIVEHELRAFPHVCVNDVWVKGSTRRGLHGGAL